MSKSTGAQATGVRTGDKKASAAAAAATAAGVVRGASLNARARKGTTTVEETRKLYAMTPKEAAADYTEAEPGVLATLICIAYLGVEWLWLRHVMDGYNAWQDAKANATLAEGGGIVPQLPNTSIVHAGIPIFFTAIACEFVVSILVRPGTFRLSELVFDMSTGMMQQLLEMFISVAANFAGLTLVAMVPYAYIFDHYRIADIDGPAGWIGTILARDFAYYVFHYASHRCAALWAIHGVHHAPSEFNYGVNLAQGALQTVASAPFFAPLALFFNPQIFAIVYPMSKIYGFFTHTRLVGKPYLLQTIFVLPPAHRVHHAGAPSWYIDKNYGEVFTIWDRIFGTWQDEDVRPIFGHVTPMASWNPFESQFAIWRKLAEKASTCSSVTDKIWCFLGPPGWDPKTGGEYPLPDTTPYNAVKYDSRLPTFETAYCGVQYLVSLAVGVVILVAHRRFPSYYSVVGLAALVVLGVTLAGRLFDRTRQAALLEIFRLLVAVPVTLVFLLYDAGLISNVAQLWSGLDFWHTLAEALNSRLVHLPPSVPAEMVFVLPLVFVLMSAVAIGLRLDTFAPESDDAWLKRVWIPEIGRNFKQSLQDANIQFWKSAPAPAHAHADSTKSAVKRGSKQNAKKVQ